MKFLNKRTGAVIDVPCRLEGPDWQEIREEKAKKAPASEPEAAPAKKTATKRRAKASD